MATIRIFLADDHAVLRAGLQALLNMQPDMKVVGEAADGHETVRGVGQTRPDVLLLDLSMPGPPSARLVERLQQDCPETRVLVLTIHDDPAYFRVMLAVGVAGYLIKTAAGPELLTAIRTIHQGRTFFGLSLTDRLVPALLNRQTGLPDGPVHQLSPREQEVLLQLAPGYTNQQIAGRLSLSIKTVETYRARIADKLGLRGRADMVRYAMEKGLLAESGTGGPGEGN
jgi:DNA-binding NarL/FixJ family response regulator